MPVTSPSPTDPSPASSPSATQDSALSTPSSPPVGSPSSPITVPTSPAVSSSPSGTSSSDLASSASLNSQSTSATSISDAPTGASSIIPSAHSSPSDTIPTNTGSVSPVTPTSDHGSTTQASVSNQSTDSGVPSSATGTGSIVTRASSSSDTPSPSPSTTPSMTDDQAYLDLHNIVRELFHAPPLTWSDDLASKAQSYAARCELKHSDGANGPVGENLVAATGAFDVKSAVKLFVQDATQFTNVPFTFSHFTQVIWQSTTQLGCGSALCDNIFPDQDGKATYHVCLYDPVGNVVGQEKENLPL
ncbi:PR-1-like protein [Cubamyces sp. BRFM 1775]|nr:PR-1-like protein [Cubamyces sp. BRFM 1775]